MQSVLHMTPEGPLELELKDGALVWPPKEVIESLPNKPSVSPSKLSLMIRLVSAACASLDGSI